MSEDKEKKRIFITGATGNVGTEVIRCLFTTYPANCEVIAGVRDVEKSKQTLEGYEKLRFRHFDFNDPETYQPALYRIDTLFLLRPPQIDEVGSFFTPLLEVAQQSNIREIVFLSVQGADKMKCIPHAKIEALIIESGIDHIFIRPSYFMQNLTTTLAEDLKEGSIVLPAGKALFNWVDVNDIAEATAIVLNQFEDYANQAFEITGKQNLSFRSAVHIINDTLQTHLTYKSVNLISFFRHKKRQRTPTPMILVMMMLHFLPRFSNPPQITNDYTSLTGKEPTLFSEYVRYTPELAHLLKAKIVR